MKKLVLTIIAMLSMATMASAFTITSGSVTTDIGELDQLIARASLDSSGDATEVAWVNNALNAYYGVTTYNFTTANLTKYDTPEEKIWKKIDQYTAALPIVALDLATTPTFYYVKTGNLKLRPTNFEHFLFDNKDSFGWAVLNLKSSFGDDAVLRIGKFSHTGELGNNTPVPEPGTIVLLGAGLLGIGLYGRKRAKK